MGNLVYDVYAIDFDDLNDDLSSREQRSLQKMFQPIVKLFNLIKYLGSILAGVMLAWGSVNLMTSGDDFKKRKESKEKLTMTMIALGVLWTIPLFLDFMFLT